MNDEVWYKRSTVTYEFPGTEMTVGKTINVTWYDGEGHFPSKAATGLPENYALPGSGSVLIGEKGSLVIPHVAMPKLFPEEKFADYKVEVVPARNHYVSWANACRGEDKTTSHFDYSGPLTEAVLLGTIAIRLPETKLSWHADKLELTGSPRAQEMLTKSYREGWEPPFV